MGHAMTGAMARSDVAMGPTTARVLRCRGENFVEFEFRVAESDLAVELVLPYPAFLEFCDRNRSRVVPPDAPAHLGFARLERVYGRTRAGEDEV